MKSELFILRN